MRIDPSSLLGKLVAIYRQNIRNNRPDAGAESPGSQDRVDLSHRAREILQVREHLSHVPSVRAEKVAALKKAIEEGTYRPDARSIADRMLRQRVLPDDD